MAERDGSLMEGYRGLDLADEKGLLCGKLLGDLGADVIKIEPPGGDPARSIGPFYEDIPHPEKSLFWFWTNLHKRGITATFREQGGHPSPAVVKDHPVKKGINDVSRGPGKDQGN